MRVALDRYIMPTGREWRNTKNVTQGCGLASLLICMYILSLGVEDSLKSGA